MITNSPVQTGSLMSEDRAIAIANACQHDDPEWRYSAERIASDRFAVRVEDPIDGFLGFLGSF